jgi:hypothetical protein
MPRCLLPAAGEPSCYGISGETHASTSSSSTAGRILGDDLDGEAYRNQPLPTQPNHVSRHNTFQRRPERSSDLVRDKEVAVQVAHEILPPDQRALLTGPQKVRRSTGKPAVSQRRREATMQVVSPLTSPTCGAKGSRNA